MNKLIGPNNWEENMYLVKTKYSEAIRQRSIPLLNKIHELRESESELSAELAELIGRDCGISAADADHAYSLGLRIALKNFQAGCVIRDLTDDVDGVLAELRTDVSATPPEPGQ
jgi:hypothetical protein